MNAIRHILVATDFSELTDSVVDQAVELAKQVHASITLVHCYEPPVDPSPESNCSNVASPVEAAAEDQLELIQRRHESPDVQIATVVRMGNASDEVNTVADERRADLIVVGRRGRRGLVHALRGGTAERILRAATRPVYVVRGTPARSEG